MHDVTIGLIRKHLENDLGFDNYYLLASRLRERSYIRWAFEELLVILYEYSDLTFVPEHISGRRKKGVFEIFDEFVSKMEYFLSLCDEILLPKIRPKIIYDNSASIKGRGMSHARKRFEIHIRKAYREYGSDSYILFGDFKKFYDNIIHKIVKKMLLELVDDDEFISWLLDVIFDGFKIDVSYMTDEEYDACLHNVFDKLKYRQTIPKDILTGEKFMEKSVNIGDQISQIIGIFYPHRIDTYVKFVRSQKYYGRYMDDWYLICRTKEELIDIYNGICEIAKELGIHINTKKTRIVKLCSSYKFLQVKYEMTEDGKLYKKINPKRVVCFRCKIKKLAIKVLEGTSTYENVENTFKSWMGAYYKLLTKVQRENLITLYEDLFNKRIDIVNKKMVITNKE